MKKIILVNILFSLLFIACSSSNVEYLPTVVYLKSPEIITINGENKTYFEFAVSDLNELEGTVNLTITDTSGNQVLNKKLDKLLFSTDGSIISFYDDELKTSDKLIFNFKVCNTDNLCREQSFTDIEINKASNSDTFNVEGKLLSDDNLHKVSVYLSSMTNQISIDKDGNFTILDLNNGKYDLYTKGKELKNGFYRYVYLKSITFNKNTKIYLYIPIDENQEYDEPLVDCSYSSNPQNSIYIIFFVIFILMVLRKHIRKL